MVAGDSIEQRQAEIVMLALLSQSVGTSLQKRKIPLSAGGYLELDGVSDDPPILCEAWAHQGTPKPAQRNKVLADAFKLLYASRVLGHLGRSILLFSDESAAQHFRKGTWAAQALRDFGIEVVVVDLPHATRRTLVEAQKRQVMISPHSISSESKA
jgi:hypothetical protein